jgi:YVTN family beta-propeller protein
VYDVPNRREIKRIRVGDQPIGVLITPDEDRVFVSNMTSDEIHVIDLEELVVIKRFETGKGPDAMGWWLPPEDAATSRAS